MEWIAAIILAGGIEAPPAEYDRAPERPAMVRHMARAEVNWVCRVTYPELAVIEKEILACSEPTGPICVVILPWPGEVSAERYADLARHEFGHCNGWRH